jgi:hypothetical protein
MRYRMVQDDDCHWYLIPANRSFEFDTWRESDDYQAGIEPDWAHRIDGPHRLTFTDPREE